MPSAVTYVCNPNNGGGRERLAIHWQARLAYLVPSTVRVADSKSEVENHRRYFTLASGLRMHTCIHAHTPTSTYTSHTKRESKGKLFVRAFSFKFGKSLNVQKKK